MLANAYVKTLDEALAEINRRRGLPEGKDMMHRYASSPYGGYVVRSMSPEFLLDFALDDGLADVSFGGRRHYG